MEASSSVCPPERNYVILKLLLFHKGLVALSLKVLSLSEGPPPSNCSLSSEDAMNRMSPYLASTDNPKAKCCSSARQ